MARAASPCRGGRPRGGLRISAPLETLIGLVYLRVTGLSLPARGPDSPGTMVTMIASVRRQDIVDFLVLATAAYLLVR